MAALLPAEAQNLCIQIVTTADGKPPRGVAIHYPATADQTYVMRRRLIAEPLLRRGIASILVTPPFYGSRKPAAQAYHYTRSLLDFCLMTNGMIVEGWALVPWARAQPEFAGANVGLTGVSMGGAIAAVAATLTAGPLAIAPCLATFSGAGVYSEGVLSSQVAWRTFTRELGCTLAEAREHVKQVLNNNDIQSVIAAMSPLPNMGPRSCCMLNARDDKYVTAAEAQYLFTSLAPTCAPGDATLSYLPGGHATSVLLGAPHFVRTIVASFDMLEHRLAILQRAEALRAEVAAIATASAVRERAGVRAPPPAADAAAEDLSLSVTTCSSAPAAGSAAGGSQVALAGLPKADGAEGGGRGPSSEGPQSRLASKL